MIGIETNFVRTIPISISRSAAAIIFSSLPPCFFILGRPLNVVAPLTQALMITGVPKQGVFGPLDRLYMVHHMGGCNTALKLTGPTKRVGPLKNPGVSGPSRTIPPLRCRAPLLVLPLVAQGPMLVAVGIPRLYQGRTAWMCTGFFRSACHGVLLPGSGVGQPSSP